MIIDRYKIQYRGVTQYKNLISHELYLNDIKPNQAIAYEKELKLGKGNKETLKIKNYLKEKYGSEWFTDKSPIFESENNGVLKLLLGNYECGITKL